MISVRFSDLTLLGAFSAWFKEPQFPALVGLNCSRILAHPLHSPFRDGNGRIASYSGRMAIALSCFLEVGAYPWTA
jgi:hypothetical protein